MKRRKFVKGTTTVALGLSMGGFISCTKNEASAPSTAAESTSQVIMRIFPLSLAQWSLHRGYKSGKLDPLQFPQHTADLGLTGCEYVSQLYKPIYEKSSNLKATMEKMAASLLQNTTSAGVKNVLIMIDGEGDLAVKSAASRKDAVINHHKWVDMAKALGCHSIRVNTFGEGSREEMADYAKESLLMLSEYAKDQDVNVIVENHGGFSSDPDWMVPVIKEVNMSNCGLLPDFGNWCIRREGGARWDGACVEKTEDIYSAVEKMMPVSFGVSAKTYAFDEDGNETTIDYYKMMDVVSRSDYEGFIGVEYEGAEPEREGILAIKALLEKIMNT